ncbi:MAG: amidohydrolase family protein [Vicinamibacterales bacterium]
MAVAVSPDGSRLVIDLQGALWTLPRRGGTAKRITDSSDDARQPAWAPDGTRIAFQGYRNGGWDLWTVRPDGTGLTSVTSGPFDDREPHWSPDGSRLAFSSDRSGNYDIWVLELASGALRRITTDLSNEFSPAWSPDGREIAFVAPGRAPAGLYAATLDGTVRMVATSTDTLGAPAWPLVSGGMVFSALSKDIVRLMLADRELSADEDVSPFRPQWAPGPDARPALIYTADGQIKERPDGGLGAARVIPFRADLDVARAAYTPRKHDFDSTAPRRVRGLLRPNLSPDGQRVVFSALGDVWIARRGETPVRMTDDAHVDTDPVWSPDGTRVAYVSDREGSLDIWVRDLASRAERRLTTASDAEMWPVWSHDGRSIAFVTVVNATSGRLSVVDVTTGKVTLLLATTDGPINPGWSADGGTVFASVLHPYSSRFREGVNEIVAIPVEGGTPRPLALAPHVSIGRRGESPAWSPDGRHVAAVLDGALHVIPLAPTGDAAGPPRRVADGLADQVSWSADSKRVLYSDNDRLMIAPIGGGSASEWPIEFTYTTRVPSDSYVIHAGRLVDGIRAEARENVDVFISRNRITRVIPHVAGGAPGVADQHQGRVVDASNLTVMPGLIEGHGHYAAEYGARFDRIHLAYGITSVRSPGGHPYASVAEHESIAAGRRAGPRLFFAGYLLDGNRIFYPMAAAAPTEAAIDRELERAQRLGYDFIKTYVRLPDGLQQRAIQGAHRIGLPVSSHEIYPAGAFGVDSVEHLAATSRRGYSPKQSVLRRAYEDVIAVVARSGMTITPTLTLGRARTSIQQSAPLRAEPRWQLQPVWIRAPFEAAGARREEVAGQRLETLMDYHRAGVPVLAGTDSPLVPYGISLHLELEYYVTAGLTPFQALQAATINIARALHVDGDLGTIEAGKLADLVIVEGNPLTDIRATRNLRTVVANGAVMTIEQLTKPAAPRESAGGAHQRK